MATDHLPEFDAFLRQQGRDFAKLRRDILNGARTIQGILNMANANKPTAQRPPRSEMGFTVHNKSKKTRILLHPHETAYIVPKNGEWPPELGQRVAEIENTAFTNGRLEGARVVRLEHEQADQRQVVKAITPQEAAGSILNTLRLLTQEQQNLALGIILKQIKDVRAYGIEKLSEQRAAIDDQIGLAESNAKSFELVLAGQFDELNIATNQYNG